MIYYFSATGNSQHVATRISEAIGTQALSIETANTSVVLTDGEPFGIITPTHWNQLPVLIREFIRSIDIRLAKDNYIFTVATYGAIQGHVCEDARRELQSKGIRMNAGFSVKMPDSWTPSFDLSDPNKVQQQVDAAEPLIDEVIDQIRHRIQGNRSKDKLPYCMHIITNSLLNYERQTKFFGVDKSQCIGCGLCAKKCPVQAIEMQETTKTETNKTGKNPVWTAERCALCLGCLHRCPKFAIHYNNKTQAHGQYLHSKYYKKPTEL